MNEKHDQQESHDPQISQEPHEPQESHAQLDQLDQHNQLRLAGKRKYNEVMDSSAGFLMGVTYRKMSTMFMQKLKPFKVTSEQWIVLYCISQRNGIIQKDIAERVGKDRPTVTRILDVLADKGLVSKKADEADRRSFLVYATAEGRQLIEQTIELEHLSIEEATAGISPEEYDLLVRLLRRIGDNIDGKF
ncbi:MarR family transcriptional regulator [Paenibacillus sp. HB172176]|uniref:MarR family winged helix-turn-helix transcriptional regulator n=1 Tax=Paenibacillus sp. HB172176 TaxID=2493690 RepID=UPI001F10BE6E|nr:MarR family transcriptional regulator [Paenibacillus sp. HB172176]